MAELGVGDDPPAANLREPPSALERSSEILERIRGKAIAVFLDYDGTLTPIVARPDQAVLPEETRRVIRRLSGLCTVAVISGRDLEDVRGQVALGSIYYGGSHGFDLAGPRGWRKEYEGGAQFLAALDEAERELREGLAVPGTLVERKRFAVAVHYRQARDEDVPQVEAVLDRVRQTHASLRKAGGKKVFELRPDIEWDKGRALLYLLKELGLDEPDVVPFYIGDDVTDEDAFRAIKECGVGIMVLDGARDTDTEARYTLDSPAEVRRFLEILAEELEGRS